MGDSNTVQKASDVQETVIGRDLRDARDAYWEMIKDVGHTVFSPKADGKDLSKVDQIKNDMREDVWGAGKEFLDGKGKSLMTGEGGEVGGVYFMIAKATAKLGIDALRLRSAEADEAGEAAGLGSQGFWAQLEIGSGSSPLNLPPHTDFGKIADARAQHSQIELRDYDKSLHELSPAEIVARELQVKLDHYKKELTEWGKQDATAQDLEARLAEYRSNSDHWDKWSRFNIGQAYLIGHPELQNIPNALGRMSNDELERGAAAIAQSQKLENSADYRKLQKEWHEIQTFPKQRLVEVSIDQLAETLKNLTLAHKDGEAAAIERAIARLRKEQVIPDSPAGKQIIAEEEGRQYEMEHGIPPHSSVPPAKIEARFDWNRQHTNQVTTLPPGDRGQKPNFADNPGLDQTRPKVGSEPASRPGETVKPRQDDARPFDTDLKLNLGPGGQGQDDGQPAPKSQTPVPLPDRKSELGQPNMVPSDQTGNQPAAYGGFGASAVFSAPKLGVGEGLVGQVMRGRPEGAGANVLDTSLTLSALSFGVGGSIQSIHQRGGEAVNGQRDGGDVLSTQGNGGSQISQMLAQLLAGQARQEGELEVIRTSIQHSAPAESGTGLHSVGTI
jgi:hypothetical protein